MDIGHLLPESNLKIILISFISTFHFPYSCLLWKVLGHNGANSNSTNLIYRPCRKSSEKLSFLFHLKILYNNIFLSTQSTTLFQKPVHLSMLHWWFIYTIFYPSMKTFPHNQRCERNAYQGMPVCSPVCDSKKQLNMTLLIPQTV